MITNKVFFLYDVGPQSRLEWLASAFPDGEVEWLAMKYNEKNRIYRWRKPLLFLSYIDLAVRSLLKSKPNDDIISWNFIIGAIVGVICHFFRLKRTILSLNMISHNKGGLIASVRRTVYNYAFSYNGFYFTVNSKETLADYIKEYDKINERKAFVLPDAYLPIYTRKKFTGNNSYIFCGGEAQRDWKIFFEAARRLPELSFVGVGRKKYMPEDNYILDNVTMYYDIEEDKFDSLLENASIVTLPLLTTKPAGLIVVFKSIFLSKPIITTRTSSIENYLTNGESAALLEIGDLDGFVKAINDIYYDVTASERLTKEALRTATKHSPEKYSQFIFEILQKH